MKETAIEISKLTVEFGGHKALNDINVQFNKGEFIAIVGPNGSGKTTLLKVILGLIKLTSGYVKVFGNDASKAPPNSLGYVPQVKSLERTFPVQAIELVASGLRNTWPGIIKKSEFNKAEKHLNMIGAGHLAKKQLNELSGGELQKIYLARSIARQPGILLLDEPQSGIDAVCEKEINSIITDYNKNYNTTVIMVTHNWATACHHAQFTLLLNNYQVSYGLSEDVLQEKHLRKAFIHTGLGNASFEEHADV